ncbi:hypothetical protein AERO9A_380014 [Aeromonas salmonicida]|nr:hypothetical protein AERO9A_380014 [Aeromonas salmonicida]
MLRQTGYQSINGCIVSVKFHTLRNVLRDTELLATLVNISH